MGPVKASHLLVGGASEGLRPGPVATPSRCWGCSWVSQLPQAPGRTCHICPSSESKTQVEVSFPGNTDVSSSSSCHHWGPQGTERQPEAEGRSIQCCGVSGDDLHVQVPPLGRTPRGLLGRKKETCPRRAACSPEGCDLPQSPARSP